jgi:hypothetical protein
VKKLQFCLKVLRFNSTSNRNDSMSFKLGSNYYCNIFNILENPEAVVFMSWRVNALNPQLFTLQYASFYSESDCTRIAEKKFVGNVAIPATCGLLLEDSRDKLLSLVAVIGST